MKPTTETSKKSIVDLFVFHMFRSVGNHLADYEFIPHSRKVMIHQNNHQNNQIILFDSITSVFF